MNAFEPLKSFMSGKPYRGFPLGGGEKKAKCLSFRQSAWNIFLFEDNFSAFYFHYLIFNALDKETSLFAKTNGSALS